MHVEQVLGDVPKAERCHCNERREATVAAPEQEQEAKRWWQRR